MSDDLAIAFGTQETVMKALILDQYAAPFRLADIATPVAGPNQVLVRIKASGVNPLDTKIRAGKADHAKQPLPAILGIDLAGTIEAVGPGVTDFKVGDDVYGMTGGVGGNQGSLAEYAAVDARLLAAKPTNLTFREAAALPLIFITAWEGLVDRAKVAAGQKVLIHGGAGGVGHIAVQIARHFGANVYATGSADNKTILENLGAIAIDYRQETVDDYVEAHTGGVGFDLVYDTAGGLALDASFKAVKRFGQVVSALGWGTHSLAPLSFQAASYSGVFTLLPLLTGIGREHHGEILRAATKLVEAGHVIPRLDPRRFSLEATDAAHQAVESGSNAGKIVIDVA